MAYHSCCPVYYSDRKFYSVNSSSESKIEINIEEKLKQEGVFFFGGINHLGEYINELKVLKIG